MNSALRILYGSLARAGFQKLPALALAVLLAAGTGLAYAQTGGGYDLTWWTVDGGGDTAESAGGDYILLSTAGQPDAAAALSGGLYTIESGFWPGDVFSIRPVYLPLVMKNAGPDLVGTFHLDPSGPDFQAGQPVLITVEVTNVGLTTAGPFWVDFYINPYAPPSVNKRWNDLCAMSPCYGLAWYVSQNLGPGESLTLTSADFAQAYSRWPGYFAAGSTDLYTYVDIWNPSVATGGVLETDEGNNMDYQGGVSVTGLAAAGEEPWPEIPSRPTRLK